MEIPVLAVLAGDTGDEVRPSIMYCKDGLLSPRISIVIDVY